MTGAGAAARLRGQRLQQRLHHRRVRACELAPPALAALGLALRGARALAAALRLALRGPLALARLRLRVNLSPWIVLSQNLVLGILLFWDMARGQHGLGVAQGRGAPAPALHAECAEHARQSTHVPNSVTARVAWKPGEFTSAGR